MPNRRTSYIYLSAIMCVAGAIGGYAITYKLAGDDAALAFLKLGIGIVFGLLAAQVIFSVKGKRRAIYLVFFNISFAFALVWFLSCLILPMLWVSSIGIGVKLLLCIFAFWLSFVNILKGVKILNLRWAEVGGDLLKECYDRKSSSIDWDKLVQGLRMSVSIYIPGIPEKLNPGISVAVVVSMIVGLSLRNIYPIFSIFAWGVPSIIAMSVFMQMMGLAIGQLIKLNDLEKEGNILIRPR